MVVIVSFSLRRRESGIFRRYLRPSPVIVQTRRFCGWLGGLSLSIAIVVAVVAVGIVIAIIVVILASHGVEVIDEGLVEEREVL
jgi:hypothetical protein